MVSLRSIGGITARVPWRHRRKFILPNAMRDEKLVLFEVNSSTNEIQIRSWNLFINRISLRKRYEFIWVSQWISTWILGKRTSSRIIYLFLFLLITRFSLNFRRRKPWTFTRFIETNLHSSDRIDGNATKVRPIILLDVLQHISHRSSSHVKHRFIIGIITIQHIKRFVFLAAFDFESTCLIKQLE